MLLAILVFIAYLGSSLQNSVTSFYCKWIFEDVGVASIMTLTMLPLIVVIAIIPTLARKFMLKRCITVFAVLALAGSLLRLINVRSVPLAFIAGCVQGIAFPAFYEETAESAPGTFEMGLLERRDWKAFWIAMDEKTEPGKMMPAQYFWRTFILSKQVKSARIYQTAQGLYEFWINGKMGTKDKFKPGFTSYYKRLQYQAYDIKELLREGDNVWSVVLADVWWRYP